MAGPLHTYGTSCLLADDDPNPSAWHSLPHPPRPRAQFFYVSSLPIDDPLSSLPPPPSGQSQLDDRVPPQPFSVRDHIALEEAWLSIKREEKSKKPEKQKSHNASGAEVNAGIAVPGTESGRKGSRGRTGVTGSQGSERVTSSGLYTQNLPQRPASRSDGGVGGVEQQDGGSKRSSLQSMPDGSIGDGVSIGSPLYRKREVSPTVNAKSVRRKFSDSRDENPNLEEGSLGSYGHYSRDASISGSPFIRAPVTQPSSPLSRSVDSATVTDAKQEIHERQTTSHSYTASKPSGLRTSTYQDQSQDDTAEHTDADTEGDEDVQSKIPVGVSRLHLVELPNLKVLFFPPQSWIYSYLYTVDETNLLEPASRCIQRSSRYMVLQKHDASGGN